MSKEALKTARIVSPKERSRTITLDWPVEFGDVTYDTVTVRRVTGAEVEVFIDQVNSKDGRRAKPPMLDCPIEVYEALDDDDRLRLEEAMLPFLPRRLLEAGASILSTTAPPSDE